MVNVNIAIVGLGQVRNYLYNQLNLKKKEIELKTGKKLSGTRHEDFSMRDEQVSAVNKTYDYFHSIWTPNLRANLRI